jgi:hypothetical protein
MSSAPTQWGASINDSIQWFACGSKLFRCAHSVASVRVVCRDHDDAVIYYRCPAMQYDYKRARRQHGEVNTRRTRKGGSTQTHARRDGKLVPHSASKFRTDS